MKSIFIFTLSLILCYESTYSQIQIGQTLEEFQENDTFGASVAINDSGDRILTSAPRFDTDGIFIAGRADAFYFDGTEWLQMGSTITGIPTELGLFGRGLDMSSSGNRIAIGNFRSKAQVYEWDSDVSNWVQMGNDLKFPQNSNVSITSLRFSDDENTLIAGGSDAGDDSVVRFAWDGNNWTQEGDALELPVRDEIAISGNANVVAVQYVGTSGEGIHIYAFEEGEWTLLHDIEAPTNYRIGDGFDLSNDGNRIVYGIIEENMDDGFIITKDNMNGNWIESRPQISIIMTSWNNALRISGDGNRFIYGCGAEGGEFVSDGAYVFQDNGTNWDLLYLFDYDNYDESINGNVDITDDGSKVIFGRSRLDEVGFVKVNDIGDVVSVHEVQSMNLSIYPNPTSGKFNVDISEKENISEILISDITGKIIQEIVVNDDDIRNLDYNIHGKAGLYFVSLISNDGKVTFKLTKQ